MIITVDGPAGAGKSTVARRLARALGLTYLNSGFIYRAVTFRVLEEGAAFEDRPAVEAVITGLELRFVEDDRTRVFLGEREVTDRLKTPEVTPRVWQIANDGGYRALLIELQRGFAAPPGVVAEGRDMGTIIFPEADLKFFLDASPRERARRTLADLRAGGHERTFDEVLAETIARDRHDREREHAPLVVPPGGIVVSTDGLDVDGVVAELSRRVGELRERSANA